MKSNPRKLSASCVTLFLLGLLIMLSGQFVGLSTEGVLEHWWVGALMFIGGGLLVIVSVGFLLEVIKHRNK